MAVEVHIAVLKLVNITAINTVIDKNAAGTTLKDIMNAPTKDFRIIPNGTGSAESPDAVDHPTVEAYLELEAAAGFALAHMDQSRIITQKII